MFETYFGTVKYILTKVAAQGSQLAAVKTVSKQVSIVSNVDRGGRDRTSTGTLTGFILWRHSWFVFNLSISELSSEILFLKNGH